MTKTELAAQIENLRDVQKVILNTQLVILDTLSELCKKEKTNLVMAEAEEGQE